MIRQSLTHFLSTLCNHEESFLYVEEGILLVYLPGYNEYQPCEQGWYPRRRIPLHGESK